jgi:hypothetical protein
MALHAHGPVVLSLELGELSIDRLPFVGTDATAGSEDELQTVVIGSPDACDLPCAIQESRFFRNLMRRSASGEASRHSFEELQEFLSDRRHVWENSWIRFPASRLSRHALHVLDADLQIHTQGDPRERSDSDRFRFTREGETWLRLPMSYALKLALADVIGAQAHLPELMRRQGLRLMRHFLNDNTSPETTSFHIVQAHRGRSLGEQVAREAARRFLLTSLLVAWANRRFGLRENGQRALVYHAPVPSVHQEALSSCISDSFYRELFMSPCLSGWGNGEEKHRYMHLCHQVLTRSQLNAIAKLRDAGIIANDLIVLPTLSNVSLANNGVHISLGSRLLDQMSSGSAGRLQAKRIGDLAIKIYEHFLALFVGTYSAAPYRISFPQFHPERLLSFLPHELDFTHLRLLWREWKEKADLRVCGRPLTPYGPRVFDRLIAKLFRLRGDCVPDARLLTYPVAWLATEHESALDGKPGNVGRLSSELDQHGILDERMSFYMPLRLREHERDGYAGIEARYYSLFPSYDRDMAPAANLQQFLQAMSYRLAMQGEVSHHDIPDDPTSESERREPFFFAAAGVPAFYVHRESRNRYLDELLLNCKKTRRSWRHPQYLRVSIRDYRRALLAYLEQNAGDLIEAMEMRATLDDLKNRCEDEAQLATTRLLAGALNGASKSAMRLDAREFNHMAEEFYREQLRRDNLREALLHLREDVERFEREASPETRGCMRQGVRVQDHTRFLDSIVEPVLRDELSEHEITTLINLLLLLSAEGAA